MITCEGVRKKMLYLSSPSGGEEECKAVSEVIKSGWWGKGPKVEELEQSFAKMVGCKHAIAVSSNTAGQDLILKALDIKDCDIINPTVSFLTTSIVPRWNNCTSNIVDVDKRNLNICPKDTRKNLKPNTKVIIAVNMAGIPAPIEELRNFFDGFIIEDCAHSCYTKGAGLKGDAAVWSFQAVKTMPCGDGGMVTTNDDNLAEKIRRLSWFGITSTYERTKDKLQEKPGYAWEYEASTVGYKYYMIDILAAIAIEQLKKNKNFMARRREIQSIYNKELENIVETPEHSETVQYYIIRVNEAQRNSLIDYLLTKNIHTGVHYKPLHLHPVNKQNRNYPVADKEWLKLISLPCHNNMTNEDVNYVCNWIKEYFR